MSDKYIKKILNQVKKLDSAVVQYTKIGKIPAIPYRAFVNLADYLFLTGCIEQSEELLTNAANFVSNSSDALINLGGIKQAAGDYSKAIEYYKKAFKKDPKSTKALCLWGNCLSLQHNIEGAIQKYEKALEIDKTDGEAYLCLGIMFLKKKQYKEAKEKFDEAIKYKANDGRPLFLSASVEIELGRLDDALDKLMFIVENTENNFGAYHNIAYIYFKKKQYEECIKYAQKAIDMMPGKIETYLLLGDTYMLIKKEKEALNVYQNAESHGLKSLFLYLSWGTAFQKMKQYDNAIEKFKQGLEVSSAEVNEELYARLAKCYYEVKNYDESKFYAKKSLEISDKNYMANEVLVDILFNERNFDEACPYLEACLINAEAKSVTYLKFARYYKEKNNYTEACRSFEKSLEYDRENIDTYLEYISYLNSNKYYETALKKLITLEKLAGDRFEVLSLAFEVNYNIALGDISAYNRVKAISVAEKLKENYPDKFNFETEYHELKSR